MAIGFARLEFVKRSGGKNACVKSAYNSRGRLEFFGNCTSEGKLYDWSNKEAPAYHDVLLPAHVNSKFKNPEVLWNFVESFEIRGNSQTAMELVMALPDDLEVSVEDKIKLIKSFVEREFVKNGLGVQIDIHRPENHKIYKEGDIQLEEKEHNWHAHVLVTTRQFDASGETFEKRKNRDLFPTVAKYGVMAGENWGKKWAQHQNEYFEEKGLSLRVDMNGIVSQIHLGPKRMRGRVLDLLESQDIRIATNTEEFSKPEKILYKITETKSVFSIKDLDGFLNKYVPLDDISLIRTEVLNHPALIQLFDKNSNKPIDKFTTTDVLVEEKKLMRLADRLNHRPHLVPLETKENPKYIQGLNDEQKLAFKEILDKGAISFIEGHAGTGKSHLMVALKKAYEDSGFKVRGLGPDNSTVQVLKDHGLQESSNIHKFLFSLRYNKESINSNSEVWIVDESGKLGNRALSELLKKAEANKAKIIFSGNSSQLPSVERGGMFKQFCERYGCSILENIQRQKYLEQREIAKKLATGDISRAFDAISSTGGFIWSKTCEDAIDAMVKKWAIDKAHFPNSKTLMIAHSNSEVRTANELARSYLKESNFISSREFECDTSQGRLYISEGDLIVFRKNDPQLKVMNGTLGILTKASEDKFIVTVKDSGNIREVIFDPKKFNSFQLGYASTYNRAQGETVERAYILHSAHINKEMFYVGLTRHVKTVACFVSKTNAKNLSVLKRQALSSAAKETTSDYTTKSEIEAIRSSNDRTNEITTLKNSTSLLDQVKGYGKEAFGIVKGKIDKTVEKYSDRISDKAFYSYEPEKENTTYRVVEVKGDIATPKVDTMIVEALKEDQAPPRKEGMDAKHQSTRKTAYSKLIPEQQALLKCYFKKSEEASVLYEIFKAEASLVQSQRDISTIQEKWKTSCCERNKIAHDVYSSITKTEQSALFSQKALSILEDRAAKHEAAIRPKVNLIEELTDNLEPLMRKLFPEGPSRKNNREFRFGAKGSLCVTYSGAKAGTYFDFEKGEGGSMLKLIEKELSLNPSEAKAWATEFLHMAPSIIVTKQFAIPSQAKKEEEWVSIKPPQEASKEDIKEIIRIFNNTYNLSATHTYRDAEGNPLFYVLRLQNEENPLKKLPLPMSYGYWKGSAGDKKWALKGYQTESGANPIYNLDMLYHSPSKRVLIVEGEKTADAANKLLGKDFVCISWQGGAGSASKAQWQHLFGREVLIWPDNDDAGFKAANDIVSCLKQVGVRSLKMVDETTLRRALPEKWDLADPLPQSKDQAFIKDCLLRAQPKAIGLDRLEGIMSSEKGKSVQLGIANEVLCYVDARLREGLEKTHNGKTWDVESGILKEVSTILKSKEAIQVEVHKLVGSSPLEEKLVNHSLLYRAKTGDVPSQEFYISSIKAMRSDFKHEVHGEREPGFDSLIASLGEKELTRKQIQKDL